MIRINLIKFIILFTLIFTPSLGIAKKISPLCLSLLRVAESGTKSQWRLASRGAKEFILDFPDSKSGVRECFQKAKKIYASRDFTPKPEYIIVDKKEYNKKISIGWDRTYVNKNHDKKWKKTSSAMKFIATNKNIYAGINFRMMGSFTNSSIKPKYTALEKVSLCKFKARYNISKHGRKSFGNVEKVVIDFNKVNFKSLDYITNQADILGFKYSCDGVCHSVYGKDFFNDNKIRWQGFKNLTIFTTRKENMDTRLENALNDIKRICNKSTTKY